MYSVINIQFSSLPEGKDRIKQRLWIVCVCALYFVLYEITAISAMSINWQIYLNFKNPSSRPTTLNLKVTLSICSQVFGCFQIIHLILIQKKMQNSFNTNDVFEGLLLMRNQHSNLPPQIEIDCFIK